MPSSAQDEIDRFARWAAAMSTPAQSRDHTNPHLQLDDLPTSSPGYLFILELRRYHGRQIRPYFLNQHYYKRRMRMCNAHRRRSLRRRGSQPLYLTARYAAWHGWPEAELIQGAAKPERSWLRIPPVEGERLAQLLADLTSITHQLEGQALDPPQVDSSGRFTWQIHLLDYGEDGEDLGLFEVGLEPDGRVFVRGGDYLTDGYSHPHVARDGRLCTGRFGAIGEWLHRDGALELVFLTVSQILRTYNPESPYLKLEELVRRDAAAECRGCGASLPADEGFNRFNPHFSYLT